ncbi:hypothetical protein OIC43_37260 [Streptomyces sp. NBC_00825]|nr:hypothetical protein OG832_06430 [Streptomyces sp. NBC_00826]WTH94287.1 hypothetical protein OIC43_37260 [Streptomyces sp. NBC_00825]WTI03022.1 hypothetical protein OHA23_37240 [Streptomyces sp. NBC_00822]
MCSCQKKKFEVLDASGNRVFGPTPYKTTADAMAKRGEGRTVREVPKE